MTKGITPTMCKFVTKIGGVWKKDAGTLKIIKKPADFIIAPR
jgi:hypothetical protein